MKTILSMAKAPEIRCPACNSEAVNRYGRAWTGKQRFLCLICKRQFTFGAKRLEKDKPICSVCGKFMHVYKREGDLIRFRCSDYPICRTYKKLTIEE
jgi:ssDNA-binding Zn-finger/Zn-ribbon topoisomerase 1